MLFSFTDIILLHNYKERQYGERKRIACSQKGEIAVTTTNYSLQSYNEKQDDACFIFQTICISLQYNRDF